MDRLTANKEDYAGSTSEAREWSCGVEHFTPTSVFVSKLFQYKTQEISYPFSKNSFS